MAAVTVSSIPTEDVPPIGIIEADDTFTAVIPLEDIVVFIAVDNASRSALAYTLAELARCVGEDVAV